MRALITGANGFVGKFLVEHLLKCGDTVYATDYRVPAQGQFSTPSVQWQNLDVCNQSDCQSIISKVAPDVIYHLAGIAFVPEAEEDFNRALLVNVGGTANILRACHLLQTGITVLVVSSAEVYGKIKALDLPLTENHPLKPANNYSLSKAMAEMVCQRYQQFGFVRTLIARPFNHIGPGQDLRFVTASFASQIASILHGKSEAVIRVGNLAARRDFSDVRDIVRGYRLAVQKGQGVYNFGSGKSVAVQTILDQLIQLSGVSVKIEQDASRMRNLEVPEVYGSYERANKELGWQPEIPLEQTLKEILKYSSRSM